MEVRTCYKNSKKGRLGCWAFLHQALPLPP
jgi:hypothetical protein